jgi:hypothetical protein
MYYGKNFVKNNLPSSLHFTLLPKDVDEYILYKQNMTNFVTARNQRILNYS